MEKHGRFIMTTITVVTCMLATARYYAITPSFFYQMMMNMSSAMLATHMLAWCLLLPALLFWVHPEELPRWGMISIMWPIRIRVGRLIIDRWPRFPLRKRQRIESTHWILYDWGQISITWYKCRY